MTFSIISNRRTEIMGFAILYIMIFHIFLYKDLWVGNPFKSGAIGVDMFLVVSGLGIRFSLDKHLQRKDYYRRRFLRIIPTFLLVAVPFSIFKLVIGEITFPEFLTQITATRLLVDSDRTFWYITAILICYAIAPIYHDFTRNTRQSAKSCIILAIFVLCYFLAIFVVPSREIMLLRLPIFFVGMLIGDVLIRDKKINFDSTVVYMIGIIGLIICDLLAAYHMGKRMRLGYAIFCIPICMMVGSLCDRSYSLSMFFHHFGKYSLEYYLVSTTLMLTAAEMFDGIPYIITCTFGTFFATMILAHIMMHINKVIK